jgi:hypothetical protein
MAENDRVNEAESIEQPEVTELDDESLEDASGGAALADGGPART